MSLFTRRAALTGLLAAPAIVGGSRLGRAAPRALNISHQFPGSDGATGDFRDRLCHRFADEVTKRTNGELTFNVYANSSLMKTMAQIGALRKGGLDLGLVPTTYGGGEINELNISFMPGIVTSYDQAYGWKKAPIGAELNKLMDAKGMRILTWVWQSGGTASRQKPVLEPKNVNGVKVRGGSREMDAMFKAAGATVATMPSNELYIALQTGNVDVGVTSSGSLISFRLQETCKHLTSAKRSYFFIFEPLLISKSVFESLPADQQKTMIEVGESLDSFGRKASEQDDADLAAVYQKAGVEVHDMTAAQVEQWKQLAADSAWKEYAARSENAAKFLKLAEAAPTS